MQAVNFLNCAEFGPPEVGFATVVEPVTATFEAEPPQPATTRARKTRMMAVLTAAGANLTRRRLMRFVNTQMRTMLRATTMDARSVSHIASHHSHLRSSEEIR